MHLLLTVAPLGVVWLAWKKSKGANEATTLLAVTLLGGLIGALLFG
jgi:hypothetical protein